MPGLPSASDQHDLQPEPESSVSSSTDGSCLAPRAGDLSNRGVIKLKGFLFLILGILASTLLLIESHSWRHVVLLAVAVWGFCRFYYFAFYVIEHYVDRGYRFAGLWDFARYMAGKQKPPPAGRVEG